MRPAGVLPTLVLLGATLLAVALLVGCEGDSNATSDKTSSPTTSPTAPTSSPTATATTTEPAETPEQLAKRLASQQVKAYIRTYDRLYAEPDLPLSIIDDYARDRALLEIKDSIQERRDRGERIVGLTEITKTWLGPEGVVFNKRAPKAVVDLIICYDLGDAQVIDANGDSRPLVGPDVPQVAQARYAVYADDWPNDDPGEWRVGKEFAAGEPCAR
jgi:hypothetical protein